MKILRLNEINEAIADGTVICVVYIENVKTPVIRFEHAEQYGKNCYRVIWDEIMCKSSPVYSTPVLTELIDIYTKSDVVWSLFTEESSDE